MEERGGKETSPCVTRLGYFEEFADIRDAIAREKVIKGWKRSRKIRLVEERNPAWEDLAREWFSLLQKSARSMSSRAERAERARSEASMIRS
jgi:hypothetical protein